MILLYVLFLFLGGEVCLFLGANRLSRLSLPLSYGKLALLFQFIVLVASVWYLGWIFGILVGLANFFYIFHETITWPVSLLGYVVQSDEAIQKTTKIFWFLFSKVFLPGSFLFMITSFFLVEYRCLDRLMHGNVLLITVGILAVGCVLRLLVRKALRHRTPLLGRL